MATAAQTTETANDTAPDKTGLRDKAREKAGSARKSVDHAYSSTRDSARKKPVAATAIAAGATAAIASAVFGLTKLVRKSGGKPKASAPTVKPSAT